MVQRKVKKKSEYGVSRVTLERPGTKRMETRTEPQNSVTIKKRKIPRNTKKRLIPGHLQTDAKTPPPIQPPMKQV